MKKTTYFATLLLVLVPFFSQAQSHAGAGSGFYFDETLFPVLVNRNDTNSFTTSGDPGVATETGLGYDLRTTLGYTFASRLFVGATYNLYHLQTKRGYVSGGDSGLDETTERSEWGPTVGWLPGNWRLLATLFTTGKKSVHTVNDDNTGITGDVTITNGSMSGYQVMAGYIFQFGSFGFGPSLVYRNVSYSKQSKTNALNSTENYDDASLTSNAVDATLTGMLSLTYQF
jgi:hypothetical protein